jgi:site-specific DNA-methyltransferase (adenine-specific)
MNGNCLELMKTLPNKSVDLFVCDLPYGCLTSSGSKITKIRKEGSTYGHACCAWDIKIDLVAFWVEVKRLCKNDKTPVLMFCNTRFGFDLINSNPDWFRYDIVWDKHTGTNFLLANKQPMKSHEMIYVFSKKGANYKRIDTPVEGKEAYLRGSDVRPSLCYGNGLTREYAKQDDNSRCALSVIHFPINRSKLHPTCKSVDIYKWLIERYSNEGDNVLDPTAGSFNSGRACVELKRNYIGMELDNDFYEKNKI